MKGESSRGCFFPGLIMAGLILLVTGFLLHRAVSRGNPPGHAVRPANAGAVPSRMNMVPLTNLPGLVTDPAFSPDGEKIAFIWDGENPVRGDVYVQLVGGEKPLRLTHTASGFICCADWSPDGRQIAFARCDDNGSKIFVVPALGGSERKLTDVMCTFAQNGFPKWIDGGRSLAAYGPLCSEWSKSNRGVFARYARGSASLRRRSIASRVISLLLCLQMEGQWLSWVAPRWLCLRSIPLHSQEERHGN